jgi:hypothetical protein
MTNISGWVGEVIVWIVLIAVVVWLIRQAWRVGREIESARDSTGLP